jgi:hypothetical protein
VIILLHQKDGRLMEVLTPDANTPVLVKKIKLPAKLRGNHSYQAKIFDNSNKCTESKPVSGSF